MGILDTIIHTKQNETLTKFKPSETVKEILSVLKERDREILQHRYGLNGKEIKTLAAIGTSQNLTRERVRQIEKDLLKNLRKTISTNHNFLDTKNFVLNVIAEHGRIIAEENLFLHLNLQNEEEQRAIVFLLNLIEELESFIHENYKAAWVAILFDQNLLHAFNEESKKVISNFSKPLPTDQFLEEFKKTEFYQLRQSELNDKIILNFLDLTVAIEKNVFGHWGMDYWKEISPKDVGGKAYLVMKYHGKPEHYSEITDMINKSKFDNRVAYKETVHNELIKDPRFILIGRGIYALSEWGYSSGVVSEVITEILNTSNHPMSREKIIEEVLKRRVVKKNTVLVGLSNKKLFKKMGKNLYALA